MDYHPPPPLYFVSQHERLEDTLLATRPSHVFSLDRLSSCVRWGYTGAWGSCCSRAGTKFLPRRSALLLPSFLKVDDLAWVWELYTHKEKVVLYTSSLLQSFVEWRLLSHLLLSADGNKVNSLMSYQSSCHKTVVLALKSFSSRWRSLMPSLPACQLRIPALEQMAIHYSAPFALFTTHKLDVSDILARCHWEHRWIYSTWRLCRWHK